MTAVKREYSILVAAIRLTQLARGGRIRVHASPNVILLSGPNGAGKTTSGPQLLKDTLRVTEFVNADTIARGLSAYDPERVTLEAGKVMIRRVRDLARQRADFAFETTLASRSFAPWLAELRRSGDGGHIVFLWLSSADLAVDRVAGRVRMGGHDVPEETIRRRYITGLRNFFELYRPLATTWRMYDNSLAAVPRLVACGAADGPIQVVDQLTWERIRREAGHEE